MRKAGEDHLANNQAAEEKSRFTSVHPADSISPKNSAQPLIGPPEIATSNDKQRSRMWCGSSRSWRRPRGLRQQEYDCEESRWTMDSHGQLLILNSRPGPRSVDAC